jgi:hypothetical protein
MLLVTGVCTLLLLSSPSNADLNAEADDGEGIDPVLARLRPPHFWHRGRSPGRVGLPLPRLDLCLGWNR